MMIRSWSDLPSAMQNEAVRAYYEILQKKRFFLLLKRIFDLVMCILMIILLCIPMLVIALLIKFDSPGPVFFRQTRITANGKSFLINKFRTMCVNAEQTGSSVTVIEDARITKIGSVLRRFRLDELPQLFNILSGDMSFVGTRPEIPKYVQSYSDEMLATLLLPAGISSTASILFRNEDTLLQNCTDIDRTYVTQILPQKMVYNLQDIKKIGLGADLKIMISTVLAMQGVHVDDYVVEK